MRRILILAVPFFALFSIEVTAEKLAKTLQSNILKFKRDYDGKMITVTGTVGIVKQSDQDFVLTIHYKSDSFSTMYEPSIWCFLDADSQEKAATLKESSSVSVKGTVERLESTLGGPIIALQKCTIL